MQPFAEILLRCDQADDQVSVTGKIIEVSRVKVNVVFFQQVNRKLFIGPRCRNSENGVPPAFYFQPGYLLGLRQLNIQVGKILADTIHELLLEPRTLLQQNR